MKQSDLSGLLPACCRVGSASVNQYDDDEKRKVRAFLPEVKTVIVVAHHVMHSLEWTWFEFPGDRAGETCPADLHVRSMAERICNRLDSQGCAAVLLPYPGECGVMFKTLAARTGLGQLGDNFLFMNTDWGPWIHLRVVLTDAVIECENPLAGEACNHCGQCMASCPAGAIMQNGFNGIRCRDKMREIRKSLGDVPHTFECESCLRACPIGEKPREVQVSYVSRSA